MFDPFGKEIAQRAAKEFGRGGQRGQRGIGKNSRKAGERRGARKDLLPLHWDTAVGGHISYGEYILEALYRESAEELGLHDFLPQALCSYVFESERERELVNVFAAVGEYDIRPDPDELAGGRFWTPEEIGQAMGKGVLTPNFEGEYQRVKDALLALL